MRADRPSVQEVKNYLARLEVGISQPVAQFRPQTRPTIFQDIGLAKWCETNTPDKLNPAERNDRMENVGRVDKLIDTFLNRKPSNILYIVGDSQVCLPHLITECVWLSHEAGLGLDIQ